MWRAENSKNPGGNDKSPGTKPPRASRTGHPCGEQGGEHHRQQRDGLEVAVGIAPGRVHDESLVNRETAGRQEHRQGREGPDQPAREEPSQHEGGSEGGQNRTCGSCPSADGRAVSHGGVADEAEDLRRRRVHQDVACPDRRDPALAEHSAHEAELPDRTRRADGACRHRHDPRKQKGRCPRCAQLGPGVQNDRGHSQQTDRGRDQDEEDRIDGDEPRQQQTEHDGQARRRATEEGGGHREADRHEREGERLREAAVETRPQEGVAQCHERRCEDADRARSPKAHSCKEVGPEDRVDVGERRDDREDLEAASRQDERRQAEEVDVAHPEQPDLRGHPPEPRLSRRHHGDPERVVLDVLGPDVVRDGVNAPADRRQDSLVDERGRREDERAQSDREGGPVCSQPSRHAAFAKEKDPSADRKQDERPGDGPERDSESARGGTNRPDKGEAERRIEPGAKSGIGTAREDSSQQVSPAQQECGRHEKNQRHGEGLEHEGP